MRLQHLWQDNWCRILLLNGVERMVAMRQGHSALPGKFSTPSSNNIELSKALSVEGGIRGWLKGSALSGLHFTGVFYPALYFSSRLAAKESSTSFLTFGALYLALDLLMMPLDRLRTLSYVTLGGLREQAFRSHAYSGALYKVGFNVPFLWALSTTVRETSALERVLAWASVALAYPLLSLKTQSQVN